MVLVKKWPFSHTFFLGNIGQGNVFSDILEQKKPSFCPIKTRSLKFRKIDIFPKGLIHGFGWKNYHFFQLFVLGNIRQEHVFYDILEQKNCILVYKNKRFKKSKNCHFSKGVNLWFWSKNGPFSNFFFRQYRPEKCLLRHF